MLIFVLLSVTILMEFIYSGRVALIRLRLLVPLVYALLTHIMFLLVHHCRCMHNHLRSLFSRLSWTRIRTTLSRSIRC